MKCPHDEHETWEQSKDEEGVLICWRCGEARQVDFNSHKESSTEPVTVTPKRVSEDLKIVKNYRCHSCGDTISSTDYHEFHGYCEYCFAAEE